MLNFSSCCNQKKISENKLNMKKAISLFICIIALSALIFTSCTDDPEAPQAIVTVYTIDTDGNKAYIKDCEVWLDIPDNTTNPQLISYANQPKYTDDRGVVEYSFDNEGIITIMAQKEDGDNVFYGQGVLVLIKDEIEYEEIRLVQISSGEE